VPPSRLQYTQPIVQMVLNRNSTAVLPIYSGGVVTAFSLTPLNTLQALGLTFDTATGAIYGVPTIASPVTSYQIQACNSGGCASLSQSLTLEVFGKRNAYDNQCRCPCRSSRVSALAWGPPLCAILC